MVCFCPGKQVCKDEEHYDDKSDGFEDEIIREIRNIGLSEHDQEVIKPIFRNTARKYPSQQRPDEIRGLHPHAVFEQVNERSAGYKEHASVIAAPVEIKTQQSKKEGEYKGVSNKTSAGKGISKEHPSDQLIDDIGQYCSKCHIPVINPCADTRDKISEYDKYSKCDAEMSEKEHDVLKGLYESK